MIQVIIPMSGLGQRFQDAGYTQPKPLIEVDGMPMIQHVVHLFPGASRFIFICNETHLQTTNMREILQTIVKNAIIVSIAPHKQGPVYAVSQAAPYIDASLPTIVSYCDYGSYWSFYNFMTYIFHNKLDGCIAAYKGFHPHMLGSDNYAFMKETEEGSMRLAAIQEKKPFTNNKMNEWASNGTYYFSSGKLMLDTFYETMQDETSKVNGEYYVSMVYNKLIAKNRQVGIFPVQHMLQWGTPYDLQVYNGWSQYFRDIAKPKQLLQNPPNTTTVLPMAGKGSRFSCKGYSTPKPLLDVNGHPMFHQAVDCLPSSTNYAFITLKEHCEIYPEVEKTISSQYPNAKIMQLDKVTEGQACTCYEMIRHLDPESPVLITACDNASYWNTEAYQALLQDETNDVIVWSFTHSATGKLQPQMYSWLDVDENQMIHKAYVKECPFSDPFDRYSIIGTFFFRKAKYFTEAYHQLLEKNVRANGEFYVDSMLNENIALGHKVKNFTIDHYICWGIPDEYETYQYWRCFFHKTVWHPYKIYDDCTFNTQKVEQILNANKILTVPLQQSISFFPHQGWADLIEVIPKLCFLAQLYSTVYIVVRRDAADMFTYLVNHALLTNVVVVPSHKDQTESSVLVQLEKEHGCYYISDGSGKSIERMLSNVYPWFFTSSISNVLEKVNYSQGFYYETLFDLSVRANYFPLLKSISSIEPCIAIHEDRHRNMLLDTSLLPRNFPHVSLDGKTHVILDNIVYLLSAKEIHCIHSMYAILTYYCKVSWGLKAPLYIHMYARPDRQANVDYKYFFNYPAPKDITFLN
jgi:NDP-sugar pyrophosphorylase family protein